MSRSERTWQSRLSPRVGVTLFAGSFFIESRLDESGVRVLAVTLDADCTNICTHGFYIMRTSLIGFGHVFFY